MTLFATGDSETSARLWSVVPRSWSEDTTIDPKVAECLHISAVFDRASDFDIIHNSFDFLPLTYAGLVSTPVVTTIHGFSSPQIVPVYAKYNDITSYVAISDADRHPALDYVATIHHGIDVESFVFHPDQGAYLAFFGRIHPDKGVVAAIETAARVGLPLPHRRHRPGPTGTSRKKVEPRIDGEQVRFLGPVDAADRSSFLGGAAALLHLIDFDEPFGLSIVESMACGTPVVACDRGSMTEIIDEGVTGTVLEKGADAAGAVARVLAFDRQAARATAVRRFSCRPHGR